MSGIEYLRQEYEKSLGSWRRGARSAARTEARTEPQAPRLLVLLAFLAVYLIWGSTYLGIKYAIETIPPFLMAGTRFILAGTALYGWSRLRTRRDGSSVEPLTRRHWYAAAITGFLLLLLGNGGVVVAEGLIPSGMAALLVATEPSWIVILNWLRPGGTPPSGKTLAGLLIGLAGIYFLIGPFGRTPGGNRIDLFGTAIVIGAAFSWAAGSLYAKYARLPASPLLSSGMQMLAGGVILMLASIMMGEPNNFDVRSVSMRSAVALIYLIIFGSIVAFTAYSWLLRVTPPSQAASYAYVNPVVAVILGSAIGGERIGVSTVIAAAVIVASVVLITSEENRERVEAGTRSKVTVS